MSDPSVPIAVIGVAALFPGSGGVDGFWRDILGGRDLITDVPPTHWLAEDYYDPDPTRPDKVYCKRGAFLDPVDMDPLEFGLPPASFPSTDASQLLSLVVARDVLRDAAQGPIERLNLQKTSIFMGATCGQKLFGDMTSRIQRPVWIKALRESGLPENVVTEVCDRIADSYVPWTESTFPGLLGNVITGRIANRFDLGGTNCVTDAACASSLAALRMGLAELYLGTSDMVLIGGVDLMNDPTTYMCFSKTPALSPSGRCRPFDAQADGTLLGEGLGLFALKRLADAERDGDRIYAVLRALGTSSDGRALSVYAPLASGQARALENAYTAAGFRPQTVELIEAHGTGTAAGDLAEFTGLRTAFGDSPQPWCALGSVKSQIGHPKAAAGAAGLFKAIMALHHKVLPPTLHVDAPNPKLNVESSAFYLNTQARPWIRGTDHPRRAGVSSFGFGGANFHAVLEEYQGPNRALRHLASPTQLVVLAAETPEALVARCRTLTGSLQAVARESHMMEPKGPARLAVVAATDAELEKKLLQAADVIEHSPQRAVNAPGLYYSWQATPGQVAFLFPGQGSQYVGMTGDLAMAFPEAVDVWDRTTAFGRLCDVVFPHPVFTDDARAEQGRRLMATEWAQPAMCAASMACLAMLRKVGVQADLVAGHSFGEITALAAGGALTTEDLLTVACRRGEFMAHDAQGAMLAVTMARDEVESRLSEWGSTAVVANHNGPRQVVLSGPVDAIADVESRLLAEGLTPKRLYVAAAFHSPLVAEACRDFGQFLADVPFSPPTVPVYSNSEAAPYPAEADAARTLLSEQIVRPVRFVEMLDAMYEAGARTFVEVGPSYVLSSLAEQCLEGRDVSIVPMDRRGQHGLTSLWHALGRLFVAGVPLSLSALWDGMAPIRQRQPASPHAIPVSGANVGRRYPSPQGMPPPNPPAAQVVASPAADTHAYAAFQQAMSEGHIQYLKTMEATLASSHRAWLESMEASFARFSESPAQVTPARDREESGPPARQESAAPAEAPPPPPQPAPPAVDLAGLLLAIVADKTGYPADMLNLDMALEADLGIDSIKRVEIFAALQEQLPHLPSADPAALGKLRTLNDVLAALQTPPPVALERYRLRTVEIAPSPGVESLPGPVAVLGDGPVADALVASLRASGTEASVVSSIPAEAHSVLFLGGLWDFPDDDSAIEVNHLAFEVARAFASHHTSNGHGGDRWFVTVQDTGGDFGLSGRARRRAWSAGLSALARTAALEWPGLGVRAIDLECAGQAADVLAERLRQELSQADAPQDVGLRADGTRITLDLQAAALTEGPLPVHDQSVLVVSGGARGVTSAVLRALATHARPRLLLMGRTPLMDEPQAYASASTDAELKRMLLEEARAAGQAPSPVALAQQARDILATREIRSTVQALEALGLTVSYAAIDVLDSDALRQALAAVRSQWGPITGLIHAAGVLSDRRIVDKTADQFNTVFDTKVRGLASLLNATQDDPLELICVFSSVVSRRGNIGQCDYAMANEVLNRVAAAEAARRPGCQVKAIAWGPWDGGMVTPGLKALFETQGIVPLPLDAGARHFVAELRDRCDVEVVVGAPGVVKTGHTNGHVPEVVVRPLHVDARTFPWLADHRIQDVVVLPVVQVLEWFLEAAGSDSTLHSVRVLKGVQMPHFDEPGHDLSLEARRLPDGAVGLSLRSADGTLHYTARATASDGTAAVVPELTGLSPSPWAHADLYGHLLFHGPSYQVIRAVEGVGEAGLVAELAAPQRSFVLDGCLQLAHLWGRFKSGLPSLPTGIGRLVLHSALPDEVRAVVVGRSAGVYKAVSDIYLLDLQGRLLVEMHEVESHGVTIPVGGRT